MTECNVDGIALLVTFALFCAIPVIITLVSEWHENKLSKRLEETINEYPLCNGDDWILMLDMVVIRGIIHKMENGIELTHDQAMRYEADREMIDGLISSLKRCSIRL